MNIQNITIVKFVNGNWGIRRGWLFYTYKDLKSNKYWWSRKDNYYTDCQGTEKRTKQVYSLMLDAGEEVDYEQN